MTSCPYVWAGMSESTNYFDFDASVNAKLTTRGQSCDVTGAGFVKAASRTEYQRRRYSGGLASRSSSKPYER